MAHELHLKFMGFSELIHEFTDVKSTHIHNDGAILEIIQMPRASTRFPN